MMDKKYKDVFTQGELEQAIADGFIPVCRGDDKFIVTGNIQVSARDSARVAAYGGSQVTACNSAQVTAYDSAQVAARDSARVAAYGGSQVTACDSAQVRACNSSRVMAYDSVQVTAYDSVQVTVCDSAQVAAYGSSLVRSCDSSRVMAFDKVRVTAYDSAQAMAYDSAQVAARDGAQVTATPYVAVTTDSGYFGTVDGGMQIKMPDIKTAEEWCEFYSVDVKDGVATLYKAVDDDYSTENARNAGITYRPGNMPSAPDWDGGRKECGSGLHFSPSPAHAMRFIPYATHFIACPVRLDEIKVHYPAQYPDKVKAPRVCAPCYEVDISGRKA